MALKISTTTTSLDKIQSQCAVIGFFEGKTSLSGAIAAFDKKTGNAISNEIKKKRFEGKADQMQLISLDKNVAQVLLLGLGKKADSNLHKVGDTWANACRALRQKDIKTIAVDVASLGGVDQKSVERICMAAHLGLYQFNDHKTKDRDKIKDVDTIQVIVSGKDATKAAAACKNGCAIAQNIIGTRKLVTTPGNIANPAYMAGYAKKLIKGLPIKCTVFDDKKLVAMKMNLFMAVGNGSASRPRMIILEYNGGKKGEKPIALIGKGITFDTGGINVKPATFMRNMKDDKAGACSVIHTIAAAAALKLKVNLIAIAGCAENMASGHCYRPDDIFKGYNGTTVEVINTDAEGRMVLADCLSYCAEKYKPKAMIDVATLTGAAIVALGGFASPVMSNDDTVAAKIQKGSEVSGEKVWRFPLWDEYDESLKSDVADCKHLNEDREAGSITAAMFLKKFVGDTPWAHIDIAGPSRTSKTKGMLVSGPTGTPVLTLIETIRNW